MSHGFSLRYTTTLITPRPNPFVRIPLPSLSTIYLASVRSTSRRRRCCDFFLSLPRSRSSHLFYSLRVSSRCSLLSVCCHCVSSRTTFTILNLGQLAVLPILMAHGIDWYSMSLRHPHPHVLSSSVSCFIDVYLLVIDVLRVCTRCVCQVPTQQSRFGDLKSPSNLNPWTKLCVVGDQSHTRQTYR
ncbi:hypothetical protein DAEQUDRAFT_273321 [Daedalea quercina L-15889]|uniref:Uncharacterized protein n=1 Tax=Daedalea quercina L-15889 TaxID=1314783 RepID=A0A165QDK7_9APHY|nr:hypothetical protein DAEQUDRAFT_273321 [Daedalea quercina L-15889]